MRWMVGEEEEEVVVVVEKEVVEIVVVAMVVPTCCECGHMHSGNSQRVRQFKPARGAVTRAPA